MNMNDRYYGFDLSPTHFAVVRLTRAFDFDGAVIALPANKLWTARAAAAAFPNVTILPVPAASKDHSEQLCRLHAIVTAAGLAFDMLMPPAGGRMWVAIEDYAFHTDYTPHRTGEVGGGCRVEILRRGGVIRLWTPDTIKYAATGKGSAEKEQVRDAMLDRGAVGIAESADPYFDYYDAYALARLSVLEVQVRDGHLDLSDLLAHERKTMLRVTPTWPTNVLARDWADLSESTAQFRREIDAAEAKFNDARHRAVAKEARAAAKAAKVSKGTPSP